MKLALKIDVTTLRGMRDGVPALVDILERHQALATFFFCVGPDHSGRAFGRNPPPGKVTGGASRRFRTPGIGKYVYGTLWPGPELGRRFADRMRAVRNAGFETGVQAFDAVGWRLAAASANAAWTAAELQHAVDRYTELFGEAPRAHAAAGWQTNIHALRLTQRLRFDYCSDGRGSGPHLPVSDAELIRCPQFPTTLPTLDEVAAEPGVSPESAAAHLLSRTGEAPLDAQVFGLRAEVEGLALAREFEQLVIGWKAQGYTLVPLRALLESVEPLALPRCEVAMSRIPARTGTLLLQGREFLLPSEIARAA